jgi:hypothetical protein
VSQSIEKNRKIEAARPGLLDIATAEDPRMATWRTNCRLGAKSGAVSRALEVEALGAVKSEKL